MHASPLVERLRCFAKVGADDRLDRLDEVRCRATRGGLCRAAASATSCLRTIWLRDIDALAHPYLLLFPGRLLTHNGGISVNKIWPKRTSQWQALDANARPSANPPELRWWITTVKRARLSSNLALVLKPLDARRQIRSLSAFVKCNVSRRIIQCRRRRQHAISRQSSLRTSQSISKRRPPNASNALIRNAHS